MILVVILPGGGPEATRRCLEHVRATPCETPREVVVAGEGRSLRFDTDVVLLDAAVRVPAGWLDRLAACARREPGVATVSPFSNDTGLCSYPRPGEANALARDWDPGAMDALFARENAGIALDIPAIDAACLFVSREAFEAAGAFDEGFCQRAAQGGLRHLLCAGLFVHREPRVTGPARRSALPEAAVRDFLDREPSRPCRRRVDLARLRASPRPRLLMVTHDLGGGISRHVRDLARLLQESCEVLRLQPDGDGVAELRWLREGEDFRAWLDAGQWEAGVELLLALGVDRVHFHHIHRLPRAALDLPRRLAVPYDVTLHDYYPICPRYHLSPADGKACDAARGCQRCLDAGPAQWGLTIAQWRELFHAFLREAGRVIVPSADVAQRLGAYYSDVAVLQWPHPEAPVPEPVVFKVVFLGSASAIKGARRLEECAADAAARRLPLHFHVMGSTDRPMAAFPRVPLTIGGSYDEDLLPRLLALERPDAFVFLSQVAETWSYTLSAAMRTGLPIVATSVGAFPERLRGHRNHVLLPREAPAAAVNDALLRLLRATAPMPVAPAAAH